MSTAAARSSSLLEPTPASPTKGQLKPFYRHLKASNGSWQASHRHSDLQGVEPNSEINEVSDDPHLGHVISCDPNSKARFPAAFVGGAMPYARSLRRPSSLMSSVLHAGERTVSTRTPATALRASAASTSDRMVTVAGHPLYVGVKRTTMSPPHRSTPLKMPRSASVTAGISGSGTAETTQRTRCSSASSSCPGPSSVKPRSCFGHMPASPDHAAPSPPPELCQAGGSVTSPHGSPGIGPQEQCESTLYTLAVPPRAPCCGSNALTPWLGPPTPR